AKHLVDQEHFRLDKLLNRTEQDLQKVQQKEKDLHHLLRENERLKKEMQQVMDREKHKQQVDLLKEQNKISEDRIAYLKDMERKLRQIVIEWKKAEDKNKIVKQIGALLFKKNEQKVASKKQKQIDSKYEEVRGEIKVGDTVKMKRNLQVGEVLELRGKRAVVKIGLLPMQIDLGDLSLVKEKEAND
ncbi:MAG: MutS2/Smr-associated SH3 domain-containing protein, partial [Flavisolibacter sp.]